MQLNLFAQIPVDSLISHWSFTNNYIDISGNYNNGTNHGSIFINDRFENPYRAIHFDGNSSYVDIGTMNSLNTNINLFSISFWIKSDTTNVNSYASIIKTINSPQAGTMFSIEINRGTGVDYAPNNIFLSIRDENDKYFTIKDSIPEINDNNWHNIIFVISDLYNGIGQLYFDGNLRTTPYIISEHPSYFNTFEFPLTIGAGNNRGTIESFFKGDLDDIRIYRKILSQEDIANIYNENICFETITVTDTLIINANLTSFSPITYNNTIKIYPNPASDHITINVDNNSIGYRIVIINSLSQTVFEETLSQSQYYIDLNNWTGNGTYFVQFYNSEGNLIDVKKIILQ